MLCGAFQEKNLLNVPWLITALELPSGSLVAPSTPFCHLLPIFSPVSTVSSILSQMYAPDMTVSFTDTALLHRLGANILGFFALSSLDGTLP